VAKNSAASLETLVRMGERIGTFIWSSIISLYIIPRPLTNTFLCIDISLL
jgi:hypothetical protein